LQRGGSMIVMRRTVAFTIITVLIFLACGAKAALVPVFLPKSMRYYIYNTTNGTLKVFDENGNLVFHGNPEEYFER
jgi:hypothetical protein